MNIKYTLILLLFSINAISQKHAFAIRNSVHQGYIILDENGKAQYDLPRYAEPIFDGIIRSGSYPSLIKIPLQNDRFPIRYLGEFYLIDMSGNTISKLHKNTEWVHPFENGISRVALKNYGDQGIFCDLYIDEDGNNVFGKIFRDGTNFLHSKAAIQYMHEDKWAIIDTKGNELLNISNLTNKPISVIMNIQEDIWKINIKNSGEYLYFSLSGEVSPDPKEFVEYKSNTIYLNQQLHKRLKKEQSNFLYRYLPRTSDHLILYDSTDNPYKTKPTVYSNQFEKKTLKVKGKSDPIVPQRMIDDFILAKNEEEYFIYKRSDLSFISSTIDMPVQVSEKVILTTKRVNDYENKNLVHIITNHTTFDPGSEYVISSNSSEISNKGDVKELILIKPSENDFSLLSQYPNVEVVSIYGFNGESMSFKSMESLESLECLNLYQCRNLSSPSLNKEKNKLAFLTIKRCNKLKHFKPDTSKWVNLKMYTIRHSQFVTGKEKKLTIVHKD
ncbi:MAG: hypothetical protein P1U56_18225 [Saprospiraceae bacterium]|nr:hypothetical protein [Saprospiraceae bacterium]